MASNVNLIDDGTVAALSSAINAGYIDIGCLTFGQRIFPTRFQFSPQTIPADFSAMFADLPRSNNPIQSLS